MVAEATKLSSSNDELSGFGCKGSLARQLPSGATGTEDRSPSGLPELLLFPKAIERHQGSRVPGLCGKRRGQGLPLRPMEGGVGETTSLGKDPNLTSGKTEKQAFKGLTNRG